MTEQPPEDVVVTRVEPTWVARSQTAMRRARVGPAANGNGATEVPHGTLKP